MELNRWRERFREHLRLRQCARQTIANYTAELAPFFAFLESQGLTSLGEVTRSVVEDYRTDPVSGAYRSFYGSEAARTCAPCGKVHPKPAGW